MKRRTLFVYLTLLAVVPMVFGSPLMMRKQTVISVPEPDKVEPLYGLSYKANAFEATISSVKLTLTSAPDADPVVGEWTFLGSNSDGQMHKVEIYTRLLDEAGTQIAATSKHCMLGGGYKDYPCKVDLKVKASEWKVIKSVRIVTDWQS
jgi:hypothetical protein